MEVISEADINVRHCQTRHFNAHFTNATAKVRYYFEYPQSLCHGIHPDNKSWRNQDDVAKSTPLEVCKATCLSFKSWMLQLKLNENCIIFHSDGQVGDKGLKDTHHNTVYNLKGMPARTGRQRFTTHRLMSYGVSNRYPVGMVGTLRIFLA